MIFKNGVIFKYVKYVIGTTKQILYSISMILKLIIMLLNVKKIGNSILFKFK